eukprot:COSAG02_NODE_2130_length_9732_cov_4.306031_1_plen_93_part_10
MNGCHSVTDRSLCTCQQTERHICHEQANCQKTMTSRKQWTGSICQLYAVFVVRQDLRCLNPDVCAFLVRLPSKEAIIGIVKREAQHIRLLQCY